MASVSAVRGWPPVTTTSHELSSQSKSDFARNNTGVHDTMHSHRCRLSESTLRNTMEISEISSLARAVINEPAAVSLTHRVGVSVR